VTPDELDCPLCGRAIWWRALRPGSPWICGACVPPLLEPDQVEWRDAHPASEFQP
jgi:hypothetical protein